MIAVYKKPFTDGEYVKECIMAVVKYVFESNPSHKCTTPKRYPELTLEQEQQRVEAELLIEEKRLQELQLQKKKNLLANIKREANQIELDMHSSYKVPMHHSFPCKDKEILFHRPEHVRETLYKDKEQFHRRTKCQTAI